MLNFKRSHRDFLNFHPPPPPSACGVWSQMLPLIEKSPPWPRYRQHATTTSWCEFSFSSSLFMMAHFHSFNRSNLSSQWRFISGNLLHPKYMLTSSSSLPRPNMKQSDWKVEFFTSVFLTVWKLSIGFGGLFFFSFPSHILIDGHPNNNDDNQRIIYVDATSLIVYGVKCCPISSDGHVLRNTGPAFTSSLQIQKLKLKKLPKTLYLVCDHHIETGSPDSDPASLQPGWPTVWGCPVRVSGIPPLTSEQSLAHWDGGSNRLQIKLTYLWIGKHIRKKLSTSL